jgi:hypothetical protein
VPVVVVGPTTSGTGVVQIQDCLSISGDIVVQLSQSGQVTSSQTVEILRTLRPDCFDETLNDTVNVQQDGSCSKVTGTKQVTSAGTTKSIFVLFLVDSSECLRSPGAPASAGIGNGDLPVGPIVGGIIGAIAVISAIAIVLILYRRNRRREKERQEIKQKLAGHAAWISNPIALICMPGGCTKNERLPPASGMRGLRGANGGHIINHEAHVYKFVQEIKLKYRENCYPLRSLPSLPIKPRHTWLNASPYNRSTIVTIEMKIREIGLSQTARRGSNYLNVRLSHVEIGADRIILLF